MKKRGIKFKDVMAMPGSELHTLLEAAASEKDGQKAQELRKKAEKSYQATAERYKKMVS
jgi:hypothetical protein